MSSDRGSFAQAGRWAVAAALVAFAALSLWNAYATARFAGIALSYPFDLDYGEGIVWQQAHEIVAGRGYAPVGVYPAVVFHYPPVYHLASQWLARETGADELFAGRLLSILSTIATMAICAYLTAAMAPARMGRVARSVTAFAAPLIFIGFAPVKMWFAFMRVDMLAGALALAGLLLAISALRRPWLVIAAALLFVLSIYTKQTSIAAPVAAFLMFLLVRPRLAFVLLLACLALGLPTLAWLSWTSDGGFLRHIVGYNLNRYSNANLAVLADILLSHVAFFGAAAMGAAGTVRELGRSARTVRTIGEWRVRHAGDIRSATLLAMLLFFVVKLAMIPMMLKSGASYNYLIEWLSSVAIFAAIGIVPAIATAFGEAAPGSALLVAVTWLLPLQALHPGDWDVTRQSADRQAAMLRPLVARIRAADKPVISDDMILLIRAGKPVRWEPAIVAELGQSGRYDDAAFARLVREHRFAFFVTQARRGDPLFDSRYNPLIADAIYQAYPRTQEVAGLIVHLP